MHPERGIHHQQAAPESEAKSPAETWASNLSKDELVRAFTLSRSTPERFGTIHDVLRAEVIRRRDSAREAAADARR
ncbi:MAG: hypothetical protein ACOYBJ_01705 [Patescibacteria group bacterium]|jgi:hypothetical protein